MSRYPESPRTSEVVIRRYLCLIAALLIVTACAGETEGTGQPIVTMTIQGRSFGVAPSVAPGASFRIDNRDAVQHTFTSPEALWESLEIPGNTNLEFSVPAELAAGNYNFVCMIHPDMSGRLTVSG